MLPDGFVFGTLPQLVQPEIGDLEHPTRGDHTVWGFKVTMIDELRVVYIDHALQEIKILTGK